MKLVFILSLILRAETVYLLWGKKMQHIKGHRLGIQDPVLSAAQSLVALTVLVRTLQRALAALN